MPFDARAWQREFRKTPAGKLHTRRMNLRKYGITPEQFDEMSSAQGGVCAVCFRPEVVRNQHGLLSLSVDHHHGTNAARGLLCSKCNRALGLLGDSAERAQALADYRKRFAA